MVTTKSISIILRQFKENHITEDEAIQLIEDLYNKITWTTSPYITWTTSPDYGTFPKYEVTCNNKTE